MNMQNELLWAINAAFERLDYEAYDWLHAAWLFAIGHSLALEVKYGCQIKALASLELAP